ncbi:MAG TPA: transcriptional repressor [Candidatus Paceibacterota bacterium]
MDTKVRRQTKVKKKIEEIFKSWATPASLKEIFEKVRKSLPKTAYSTVFRVVENLEKEKLLNRINWRERGTLYEWSERAHHHHLVCEQCDSVEDISDTLLCFNQKKVANSTGFVITNHSIELTGVCKPCRKDN